MSRRIAFCADGSWESVSNSINVYRIYKAIVPIPGEQYSFYDDGVGAGGEPIEKILGGAFGTGFFQKGASRLRAALGSVLRSGPQR